VGHRLPVLKPRELVALLERLGFHERDLKATSHRRFVHPDGRRTTVPVHPGRDVGRGLLRKILKDISISPQDLDELLK
jgi:predicted RNA binding protein YcfA (HicA-like mRNA interferase family)